MAAAAQKRVLTDRGMQALKPAERHRRYIVWDAAQPHLGVRVTDKGAKSFIVVRRRPGQRDPDTHVLGRYPAMSLKAAREAAPSIIGMLAAGESPKEARQAQQRAAARKRADTFAVAVEAFIAYEKAKGLRTAHETAATLRREFLGQVPTHMRGTSEIDGKLRTVWTTEWLDGKEPAWRARPVTGITRRDIIERLEEILKERGKYAARHALNAVRKLLNWAADGERFGLTASVAARVSDKTLGISGKDLKRKRVLDDGELRDVWEAAGAVGFPFGPLVQLLMLDGQRLNDVARAQRSEVDFHNSLLIVPPERYKTGTAHEVPLPPRTAEILRTLPRFKGDYLFTTTAGDRPVSGISKMKERLDALVATSREKRGLKPMPPWVLHDLRRTVRTRLSELGVDSFTAERVIGHAMPGLHEVYDQGTHRAQKRAALEKWEARLLEVAEPDAGNVVRIDELDRRRNAKPR